MGIMPSDNDQLKSNHLSVTLVEITTEFFAHNCKCIKNFTFKWMKSTP